MSSREEQLYTAFSRNAAVIAAIAILVLLVVFWLLPDNDSRFANFCSNFIPEIISLLIVVPFAYIALKKIEQLRKESDREHLAASIATKLTLVMSPEQAGVKCYADIDSVPWDSLIRTSTHVDILVHFWPNWIARHSQSFQELFGNGGSVRLILPDESDRTTAEVIQKRLPDVTVEQIQESIRATLVRLKELANKAGGQGHLEVYSAGRMMWYCGLRFDRRDLVISLYEHERFQRIGSPTLIFDLGVQQEIGSWFDKEFNGLKGDARRVV
jgi:fumarate reductase subunit D